MSPWCVFLFTAQFGEKLREFVRFHQGQYQLHLVEELGKQQCKGDFDVFSKHGNPLQRWVSLES